MAPKKNTCNLCPVTEDEAYEAMHQLRCRYAIGELSESDVARIKEVDPDVLDTLDDLQINELSVYVAIGVYDDNELASLKTKFPAIKWDEFTSASFVHAIKAAKDADPSLRSKITRLGRQSLESREWSEFACFKYANRPIGMYLREMIRLARGE